MATAIRTRCIQCNKEKATIRCGGCLQEFCYDHWEPHRQELEKQFDEIEVNRDLFRQSLTQHIEQSTSHILMKKIDKWEQNSFKIIKQTAEEARQLVIENKNELMPEIEMKLNELTKQLRQSRDEDDFNEINLRVFQETLDKLTDELINCPNISIREAPTSFINKIYVHIPTSKSGANIYHNPKWVENGVTVAGGNKSGYELYQLNWPMGMYVDNDQTIYVADSYNHRIIKWRRGEANGQVVAGGNGKGNQTNQLNWPTDVIVNKKTNNLIICDNGNRRVIQWPLKNGTSHGQTIISDISCRGLKMDNNQYIYVSDCDKNEVRRWEVGEVNGTLVAGGNGKGRSLNQLDAPTHIFIDDDHAVYVSDSNNHRVMKWIEGAKEGIVVAGSQNKKTYLAQLSYPQGLFVDHLNTVYVADYGHRRIIRWLEGATQGDIIVGENWKGDRLDQIHWPEDLSFDQQGNLYVVDCSNHRIQRYNVDQN